MRSPNFTSFIRYWISVTVLSLAACGSGGSGPAVATLSASNVRFGSTSTITISGNNLRSGIEMAIEGGCTNLTKVANGTDETQQYTCDVRGIGEIKAYVIDAAGAFIAQLTLQVPVPQVSVTTSMGSFVLELDADKAPATTLNFLSYVTAGFYRNVLVHRAIKDVGVLTGGYSTGLRVKPPTLPEFALESNNGLKNLRGTIGMFHGASATSARAQWYVNVADNGNLDFVDESNPGFAVFGQVVSGLEVIDAISAVATKSDSTTGLTDVPVKEILITAISQLR